MTTPEEPVHGQDLSNGAPSGVVAGDGDHSRTERALGPALAVVLALWMVRGVAGGRPPAGDDVMAHLARVEVGLDVLAGGRLDGWFPSFMLGIDEFLFYGQGFTLLVGLVKVLGLGLLSTVGAYKLVTVASFAATGPAVAFFVRSLGLGHRVAGAAAVLALLVSSPFGGGINGLYLIGMAPHQVGAVLFFVVLGCVARTTRDPTWWWRAALAAAALVITHVISVMVLAVMLPLVVAPLLVARRRPLASTARHLVLAAAAAAGIAAFWLVPAVAFRDQRGVVTTWATPPLDDRLVEIARTALTYPAGVAYIVAVAMPLSIFVLRGRRVLGMALALTPVAYLAIAHTLAWRFNGNSITLQLANRGLGYAATIAVVPLAVVVVAGADAVIDVVRRWRARAESSTVPDGPSRRRLAALASLAAATAAVVALTGDTTDLATQQPPPADSLVAAARSLARAVPPGARFATERAYPDEIAVAGLTHPDYWLAQRSGRNTLNIFNPESTPAGATAFVTERIPTMEPIALANELGRLGTTHVVAIRAATLATLVGSGRFVPVDRGGGGAFAILEVQGASGQPPPATGVSFPDGAGSARRLRSEREHLAFEVEPDRDATAEIAVAWSPRWRATVDGRAVAIDQTSEGLMRVAVERGPQRVVLRHAPTVWDHLGLAITLVSGAALASGPLRRRLRKRSG